MEYRDLTLNDNVTTYRVVDEDKEYFQSVFDELLDNSMSVSEKWREIVLLKSEQKLDCDFSQLDEFGCFLISSRAKELLTPFLSGLDIEYLPCRTEDGIFYILNTTRLIEDSIMDEASEFEISDGGIINQLTNIVFYFESVEDKHLFKIKELPNVFFVSEAFEEFYTEHKLNGLDFSDDNPFIAADFV